MLSKNLEYAMKKLLALIILSCVTLTCCSCRGGLPAAHRLLSDFTSSYGICGVLYSYEAKEGEEGFIADGFFTTLYGREADFENDFAVFLSSSVDTVYEAAVFVTEDESSRISAEELCRARLDLLSKMGFGESAIFITRRSVIFYSTFPDAERAERIWLDINV